MRVLIAQMTRMGDMLQTTALVRCIKTKHPDAHITAMVRDMGEAIVKANPDIDDVIVYDEDEMYLDMNSDDSDRLLRAYERADGYVRDLQERRFNVIYNCTHSLASAMLFKLVDPPQVVGAHLSDDWQFVLRGRGPNYFFTNARRREHNSLNICDQFRLFLEDAPLCQELVFDVTDEDRRQAAEILGGLGIGPRDFLACFQLGASDRYKRWPEAHFAALGKQLADQRNARIVLLGVKNEADLGRTFDEHAPGLAAHLFGKTTIPQLAAVLERTNVLVTNDTGTMHIAAAVKCPIVLVSVGYVHFRETGPYGAGHCAIESNRRHLSQSDLMRAGEDERHLITPDQVLRAVDLVLEYASGEPASILDPCPELDSVVLHMSGFAPDGCLDWYPVLPRPLTERDYLRVAYRAMWLEFLTGKRSEDAENDSIVRMLGCYTCDNATLDAWRKPLVEAFDGLANLAQQGVRKTERLLDHFAKNKGMGAAKELVGELSRLDEEIRLFGEVHPATSPLVATMRFERDNLEGADPNRLAKETLTIYRDLHTRSKLTAEKLERIVELSD